MEKEQASGKDMGVTSWIANGLTVEEAQYVLNTGFSSYPFT